MTDRENVIKGLEVIFEETADMFYRSTIQDALALLKAQEPVEPTWRRGLAFCSSCGRQFCHGFKYCPDCGRAVKWE